MKRMRVCYLLKPIANPFSKVINRIILKPSEYRNTGVVLKPVFEYLGIRFFQIHIHQVFIRYS